MSLSILIFSTLVATAASASPSLCNQLSSSSCTTDGFSDGTGLVKSESQIRQELHNYSFKSDPHLSQQWINAFKASPTLKDKALKATGLNKDSSCNSKENAQAIRCQLILQKALAVMIQKQAFGPLAVRRQYEKVGALADQSTFFGTSDFKRISQNYKAQAQKNLSNPALKTKIESKIFPQVKELLITKISSLNMDPAQKGKMIAKIKAIQFGGTDCKADATSPQYLITNAYYQPDKNTFNICEGYLFQSNSEFQLATTIIHELTHSIDPCYIQLGPENTRIKYAPVDKKSSSAQANIDKQYPLSSVISCLRSSSSIQAKAPAAADYFCRGDQIGESFADWMAAEIVPQYISKNHRLSHQQYQLGYSNARRPICTPDNKSLSGGVHPQVEKRIDAIIATQPLARKQMGCTSPHPKYKYCPATGLGAKANSGGAGKGIN